jgi:biotin carboxyl carrier protein
MPEEMKPKTLADIKKEEELIAKAKAGKLIEKPEPKDKPQDLRQFDVFVDNTYYLVEVSEKGGTPKIVNSRPAPVISETIVKPANNPNPQVKPSNPAPEPKPAPVVNSEGGTKITAPMPGMFIRYEKKPGDPVKQGETVLVLEAMKMYNNIPSPVDGVLVEAPFTGGANVAKGDVLAVIK